jgi:hypothetical protein
MLGAATPCNTINRAYGPYAGGRVCATYWQALSRGAMRERRKLAFDIRRAVEPYNSLMR